MSTMFKLSAILLSPTVPPKIDNKSMKLTITQLRKSLNPNYFSLDTQIPHCHLALLKAYSVKSNEIMCFLPMLTYAVLGLPLLSSLLQSKSNHFFLLVHQTVSNANDHIMLDTFLHHYLELIPPLNSFRIRLFLIPPFLVLPLKHVQLANIISTTLILSRCHANSQGKHITHLSSIQNLRILKNNNNKKEEPRHRHFVQRQIETAT